MNTLPSTFSLDTHLQWLRGTAPGLLLSTAIALLALGLAACGPSQETTTPTAQQPVEIPEIYKARTDRGPAPSALVGPRPSRRTRPRP